MSRPIHEFFIIVNQFHYHRFPQARVEAKRKAILLISFWDIFPAPWGVLSSKGDRPEGENGGNTPLLAAGIVVFQLTATFIL
ncbi:MAG: hypothetical protein KAJ40_02265 [Alphaproteobacteria bacterium]|nr:hypothetical protein [Alphaproteobacteria bacterium]